MSHEFDTATSSSIAKHKWYNDLRCGAPASDVRIFKVIDGKEILVDVKPATSYIDALKKTNEKYSRRIKLKEQKQ
jgi:hypothetical protein